MRYLLTTQSPVHVGCGATVKLQDQFLFNDKLYPMGMGIIISFLETQTGGFKFYSQWMDEQAKKMAAKGGINTSIYGEICSDAVLEQFLSENDLLDDFEFFLENEYEDKGIDIDPYSLQDNRELSLHLRTGTGKPLIPGSTIKGAIRTALMHHYLCSLDELQRGVLKGKLNGILNEINRSERFNVSSENETENELERRLKDQKRRRKNIARKLLLSFENWLEHECFYCYSETARLSAISKKKTYSESKPKAWKNDATMDLLKFLQVSDPLLSDDCPITKVVAGPRYVMDGKEIDVQDQTPHLEVIPSGNNMIFELKFKAMEFQKLVQILNRNSNNLDKDLWTGIEKKVKWVFGLDWEEITSLSEEELSTKVLAHIGKCTKAYSDQIEAYNQEWLGRLIKISKAEWFLNEKLKWGKEEVAFKLEEDQIPIHFGSGKGFHGSTVVLFFLNDSELKEPFRKIKRLLDKGSFDPNSDTRNGAYNGLPISQVLANVQEGIIPLGYASIEPCKS